MSLDDCVFCRIVARTAPATVVFENELTLGFLPLPESQLAPGHVLVVPKRHARDLFDASPADLDAVIYAVRRIADGLRGALSATGVNILNASGPDSDQSVFHVHFHVVPRWSGDGLQTWPVGTSEHRVAGDVGALIRDYFSAADRTSS